MRLRLRSDLEVFFFRLIGVYLFDCLVIWFWFDFGFLMFSVLLFRLFVCYCGF